MPPLASPTPAAERIRTWGHFYVTTLVGTSASVILTTRAGVVAGQLGTGGGIALSVLFLVAVGFGEGLIIGGAQWSALSRFMKPEARADWLKASSVGVGAAWLLALGAGALAGQLFDVTSAWVSVAAVFGGCLIGALIGGAQWWSLRRAFEGAPAWIVGSAIGWCASTVPVFVAAPRLITGSGNPSDVLTAIVVGLLSGGVGSAIIATAFESLVRRAHVEVVVPPRAMVRRARSPVKQR